MTKKIFYLICLLLPTSIILTGWGWQGHAKINPNASLSFNEAMSQFQAWTSALTDHASDADDRKATDPTEAPKHYIDIDNYAEFLSNHQIPQTIDSAIAAHSETFVYDNGILPWATLASFDSLKSCFERNDWDNAVLFASDLGHYVADGHMPLHITANYDGANTGNSGIHSRYESTMINANISQITYTGEPIAEIANVNQYVFDYLYTNTAYVDSVIAADDYAKGLAGGSTSNTTYKQALWAKTKGFTTLLFKNASHALAELIYTAWIQAGSPSMSSSSVFSPLKNNCDYLNQNTPNPVSSSTQITFGLKENSKVLLQIKNLSGNTIACLTNEFKLKGDYSINWNATNLPNGIYYVILNTNQSVIMQKLIVISH